MSSSRKLVYGVVNDNLVLMPERVARAYAEDHAQIRALQTFGEARRFEPQGLNAAPGLDEADYEVTPADGDAYEVTTTDEYQDDWPPSAATIALGELDEDLDDVGEERDRFPNAPILYIDPSTELDLVETLRQRGYEVRRDDELIGRI